MARGLGYRLEELGEEVGTNNIEGEVLESYRNAAQADVVESNIADLRKDDEQLMEDHNAAAEASSALSEIAEIVESAQESLGEGPAVESGEVRPRAEGMTYREAHHAQARLEAICRRCGTTYDRMIGLRIRRESFGSRQTRISRTRQLLESSEGAMEKIWNWIRQMWNNVKSFFSSMFAKVTDGIADLKPLMENLEAKIRAFRTSQRTKKKDGEISAAKEIFGLNGEMNPDNVKTVLEHTKESFQTVEMVTKAYSSKFTSSGTGNQAANLALLTFKALETIIKQNNKLFKKNTIELKGVSSNKINDWEKLASITDVNNAIKEVAKLLEDLGDNKEKTAILFAAYNASEGAYLYVTGGKNTGSVSVEKPNVISNEVSDYEVFDKGKIDECFSLLKSCFEQWIGAKSIKETFDQATKEIDSAIEAGLKSSDRAMENEDKDLARFRIAKSDDLLDGFVIRGNELYKGDKKVTGTNFQGKDLFKNPGNFGNYNFTVKSIESGKINFDFSKGGVRGSINKNDAPKLTDTLEARSTLNATKIVLDLTKGVMTQVIMGYLLNSNVVVKAGIDLINASIDHYEEEEN